MDHTPATSWDLADLAATGDIATEYGVGAAAVSNWVDRYEDFPPPLTTLSTGPVFSRRQVRQWHDLRWPTFRKNQRRPHAGGSRPASRAART